MRVLAVDFGTSNTVAALAVDEQAPRAIAFDASPLLPSAVFVGADGQFTTGREALRQARLDPSRFEPNPKRRIDDGDVLLGDRVVSVVDLIAAVLRTVAVEVRRQLAGASPDEVRLTHPARWGASRQNTLVSAARQAGLGGNLVLLPEPVAAAAQFTRLPGRSLPPGGTVAVYDLGGGTFDIAVVGRAADADQEAFHVLAEAGLPDLGGLDFDQAVLDHLGAGAGAVDPVRWDALQHPTDASGRRAARTLSEDVRAAKETLSRYPQTDIVMPEPFPDQHLTRTEFEGLIRANLSRSAAELDATLRAAGIAPARLGGIFLVGGSSRIPLVARLIQERLGVTPVALDQPETSVALGALAVPLRREGQRTVVAEPARSPGDLLTGPGAARPSRGAATPRPLTVAPVPSRRRTRRGLVVALVAGVVALAAVLLLVVRPFSGSGSASGSGPGSAGTSGSAASPGSGAASASGPVSAASGSGSAGVGPGDAFTSAELDFLGTASRRLEGCTANSGYNGTVPASLKVQRAVRCTLPDAMTGSQYEKWILWVFSPVNGDAGAYLDAVRAASTDKSDPDNLNTAPETTYSDAAGAGTGRSVVAVHLPALGTPSGNPQGVSVLAWTLPGRSLVGLLDVQSPTQPDDLRQVWAANFGPR